MVDSSAIHKHLKTKILAPKFHCYSRVNSTNNIAKELLENGAQEGTVVIADEQYAGKGRHNRSWWSPYGGIYLSLIINPEVSLEEFPLIGLIAGCAVVKAITQVTGLYPLLKWPNDIMLKNKKLGGILCELVVNKERKYTVVIGIGINQNIPLDEIPPKLQNCTTSIKIEMGEDTSREELIALILNGIDSRLHLGVFQSSLQFIVQEWKTVTNTTGQCVEVKTEKGSIRGQVTGIGENGSLQLSTKNGLVELRTGDVLHLQIKKDGPMKK
jgi:BirA family biotin operon repressor/biotin-[acetyl-CoA-carboxylase] ligase